MNQRLPLSQHLSAVFKRLPSNVGPNDAVLMVLSFADEEVRTQDFACQEWLNDLRGSYYLDDAEAVKKFIGNRFTHLLADVDKSSLGKYYSPTGGIRLTRELLHGILLPSDLILDLCVGCGAFAFEFNGNDFYGHDIDPIAIQILRKIGFPNMAQQNSLACAGGAALNLPDGKRVLIVGNPPCNDRTSKNRRGTKVQTSFAFDKRIEDRDLGIAFMRTYFLIQPRAVAVLHPFSYILKRSLYQKLLGKDKQHFGYRLQDCVVFSSRAFATHGANAFPYVAALWTPRDLKAFDENRSQPLLTSEQIREEHQQLLQKSFRVVEIEEDKVTAFESPFCPARYKTIDDPTCHINKYADSRLSNIGLYQYNFRDLNSLLSNGNLTNKRGNTVAVNLEADGKELVSYCALNAIKRHWKAGKKPFDFILGNLSPIYPGALIVSPLKVACLVDAYFANEPKFQPGMARLRPWISSLAKAQPTDQLLVHFAEFLNGEDTVDREALRADASPLVKQAVNALR